MEDNHLIISQKTENLAQIIGLALTWLIVGGIILVQYSDEIFVVIIAIIFIAAAVTLPTGLLVGLRQGKVRFPTIRIKDRLFFIAAIIGTAAIGIMSPAILGLFK